MSKHRQRVQLRRKRGALNSERTGYGAAILDIYRRATQGGSESYLAVNQPSDPHRVAKILGEAQARRERRGDKVRTLTPRHPGIQFRDAKPQHHYAKLPSGQIMGSPRPMREVKHEARQSRLARRKVFRDLRTVFAATGT